MDIEEKAKRLSQKDYYSLCICWQPMSTSDHQEFKVCSADTSVVSPLLCLAVFIRNTSIKTMCFKQ